MDSFKPIRCCLLSLGSDMRRREFITLLGGAAVAWPLAARAKQPERVQQIGVLMQFSESNPVAKTWITAFEDGLLKLGWAEGRNIHIDYRWVGPDLQKLERFAKELVALQPNLIVASSTPTTRLLMQETHTIP